MGLSKFSPSSRFSPVFPEFPEKKSSPKTEALHITKYYIIKPILTSYDNIQKIIASRTSFGKIFISSQTSELCRNKNLLCK